MKKLFASIAIVLTLFTAIPSPMMVNTAYAATDIKNDAGLSTNLVSFWELEEASGTRVDSHTSGNDLTDINTVGTAAGIQGQAADFESTNTEYLEIIDTAQTGLSISGDLTIAGWIKLESLPGTGAEMWIANKYFGSAPRSGYGFSVSNRSGNYHLNFRAATAGAGFSTVDSTTNGITTATWYHVAAALDVSADTVDFYVNGSSWGTDSLSSTLGGSVNTGANTFRVGGQPGTTAETIDGIIDDLGIWSRKLSSSEISELYNSGTGIPYDAGGGSPRRIIRTTQTQ